MKNLKKRTWDRILTIIVLLAYNSKKLPVAVALFVSCTVAVGQVDWMMLDLEKTAPFDTTQEYCEHLTKVYRPSLASEDKSVRCPCAWSRIKDVGPSIGEYSGKVRLRLFSAKALGISNEQLDLKEMNRRADSLGYEPCNLRVSLRLLELMKEDPTLMKGHTDLVIPIYNDGDVEFTRVVPGDISTGVGEWLPNSEKKRAWLRDVMREDEKFVYRKK